MKKLVVVLLVLAGQSFAAKKYDHTGRMEYHAAILESILNDADKSSLYHVGDYTCLPATSNEAPYCAKDEHWYKVVQRSYTVIILENSDTITVHELGQDPVDSELRSGGSVFSWLTLAWEKSFDSQIMQMSPCHGSFCAPEPKPMQGIPDGAKAEFHYRLGKVKNGIQEIEIEGLEHLGPGWYRPKQHAL